jgi:hypothetical protein
MLQQDLGHSIMAFGGHGTKGRRKADGTWITATFNPDGQTFKDRYGFTLEETNGSPVGERGPAEELQAVIRNADNPFMIENNADYWVRTYWDVLDCRYVMVGSETAYDKIVLPILDRYQPGTPPVVVPPAVPPGDPCAEVKKQLAAALATLATDGKVFAAIAAATDKAKKTLPAGAGGGQYAQALRFYIRAIEAAQGTVKA